MKKLTHEDAEQKLIERGIEVKMVDQFIDRRTKMKFRCVCGEIFESNYATVIQGCQCGCKNRIDYVGKRFENLVVIEKTDKKSAGKVLYLCRCDCGKEILTMASSLVSGDRKSCGCQRKIDIEGLRSGRLVAIKNTNTKDNRGNYLWECKCDCGNTINVAATYLTSQKTQSCGCVREEKSHEPKCYKDYSGQTFDYLYVKEKLTEKNVSGDYLYLCECKCGKQIKTTSSMLLSGDIKSCGCRPRVDILDKKFGRLTVIELIEERTKNSKRLWKCLCECGRETILETSQITCGHTKSCGNCGMYVKGVRVSWPQLELHRLLGRGVLNFKTRCGLRPDIAFVHNGEKIAIEYDEEHWHDEKEDEIKTKRLLDDGWKVIRILVKNTMPNQKFLDFINQGLGLEHKCCLTTI